jgi:ketosteroid isomerase-like protein
MRRLFVVNFVLMFFISCNTNKSELIMSKNIELVKTYFALFNNNQWNELSKLYIEDAEFKDPSLGQGVVKQTREQFIVKYSELNAIFPDLRDDIVQIYPSGEKHVIVEFISSGTAEDNSKFELPICTIFTIENGQIIKDYSYFDNFDENK